MPTDWVSWPALLLAAILLSDSFITDASAASTIITSGPDGTINCDGMACPPASGVRCVVTAGTISGSTTVLRRCLGTDGTVLKESTYNVNTPGSSLTGLQIASSIMYTQTV